MRDKIHVPAHFSESVRKKFFVLLLWKQHFILPSEKEIFLIALQRLEDLDVG